jgi:hypothetical protein
MPKQRAIRLDQAALHFLIEGDAELLRRRVRADQRATPASVRVRCDRTRRNRDRPSLGVWCVYAWPSTKTGTRLSVRIITNCESGQSSLPKYTCWMTGQVEWRPRRGDQPIITAMVRNETSRRML